METITLDTVSDLNKFAEETEHHYVIQVYLDGKVDLQQLKHELQWAYDQGAEGFFAFEHTVEGNTRIAFLRTTTDDDPEYLKVQQHMHRCSIERAAFFQLALELAADPISPLDKGLAQSVIDALIRSQAIVYDPQESLRNL